MKQVITISGQPGSGTTTLSEALVEEFDAAYVNAGEIFRSLADAHNMSLDEFSKHVNENPDIDREIDYRLRNIIESYLDVPEHDRVVSDEYDNLQLEIDVDLSAPVLVLESRLAGWIAGSDAALRLWCQAPLEIRCGRIESSNREETREKLVDRQTDEAMRYDNWYAIDISDTTIYDCVLNTARWGEEETKTIVTSLISLHCPSDDEGATPTNSPFV